MRELDHYLSTDDNQTVAHREDYFHLLARRFYPQNLILCHFWVQKPMYFLSFQYFNFENDIQMYIEKNLP